MFQESSSKSQSSNDRGLSSHFEESLKLSNVTLIDSEVNGSVSSLMSCAEIVTLLARHGCQDLTPLLSSESISQYPVSTGGFGDIYRGRLLGNHKVAIKTVRVFESCELGKYHKSAARELYTWSKCRHPNVVELMGLVTFRGSLAMVSVWAEHGTLPAHLKKNPSTDRCSLSTLICRGLVYLHANSIIHGDLKGDNVLISADGNPMLNDFGNASVQNASLRFSQTTTGIKYSTRWAAPEIIMETTLLTREADIYALGMTILETFSGDVPYAGIKKDLAVMHNVIYKKELPSRPINILTGNSVAGNRIWDMLTTCWSHIPGDRPSAMNVQRVMESIEPHMFLPLPSSVDGEYNHALDARYMNNYPGLPSRLGPPDDTEEAAPAQLPSQHTSYALAPANHSHPNSYQPSSFQQRSLFCQCNKTPCACWPSATFSHTPTGSQSQSQSRSHPPSQPIFAMTAGLQSAPVRGWQLPTSHNPPYTSPSAGLCLPAVPAISRFQVPPPPSQATVPLPEVNPLQLHPLLKAQSILYTPGAPPALCLCWDVRDPPTTAVIRSQRKSEYLYVSEYFYKHSDSMAHATDPPVSFLLIACNDTLPWLTPVHARESSGVTVRDVLEAISEVTHIQIEESVTQLLPTDKDRAQLYQAYHDRVKRNGGADKEGILAVDWLGRKTSFVCLARDEAVARKRVVEEYMWPFVFTLKLKTRKNTFLA